MSSPDNQKQLIAGRLYTAPESRTNGLRMAVLHPVYGRSPNQYASYPPANFSPSVHARRARRAVVLADTPGNTPPDINAPIGDLPAIDDVMLPFRRSRRNPSDPDMITPDFTPLLIARDNSPPLDRNPPVPRDQFRRAQQAVQEGHRAMRYRSLSHTTRSPSPSTTLASFFGQAPIHTSPSPTGSISGDTSSQSGSSSKASSRSNSHTMATAIAGSGSPLVNSTVPIINAASDTEGSHGPFRNTHDLRVSGRTPAIATNSLPHPPEAGSSQARESVLGHGPFCRCARCRAALARSLVHTIGAPGDKRPTKDDDPTAKGRGKERERK